MALCFVVLALSCLISVFDGSDLALWELFCDVIYFGFVLYYHYMCVCVCDCVCVCFVTCLLSV